MSRNFMQSRSIKETLEGLVEQKVTIILISGQKLTVEVDAVVDGLLIASMNNKILFISIECICVIVTCCEEVLESLLNKRRMPGRPEEESKCGVKGKMLFEEEGSLSHENFDF